jgi:hypothetical protein
MRAGQRRRQLKKGSAGKLAGEANKKQLTFGSSACCGAAIGQSADGWLDSVLARQT